MVGTNENDRLALEPLRRIQEKGLWSVFTQALLGYSQGESTAVDRQIASILASVGFNGYLERPISDWDPNAFGILILNLPTLMSNLYPRPSFRVLRLREEIIGMYRLTQPLSREGFTTTTCPKSFDAMKFSWVEPNPWVLMSQSRFVLMPTELRSKFA